MADPDFEVIRRAWEAGNRGDEDGFRAELHEEIEVVPLGAAMEGRSYRGQDAVMGWWKDEALAHWDLFRTIPESFRRVEQQILVTGRWEVRGHASGVELELPATWVVEVRDGKIVAWETYTERDHALRRLGLDAEA